MVAMNVATNHVHISAEDLTFVPWTTRLSIGVVKDEKSAEVPEINLVKHGP
jgi:hypothetical protein